MMSVGSTVYYGTDLSVHSVDAYVTDPLVSIFDLVSVVVTVVSLGCKTAYINVDVLHVCRASVGCGSDDLDWLSPDVAYGTEEMDPYFKFDL